MIHTGDCREIANKIKAGTVDLVLTDPPYGTMKGVDGIDGWEHDEVDWDTAIPAESLIATSERLLRKGGRAIFFSQEPFTSNLVSSDTATLPFSYRMVWKKNVHGNTLLSNVAPVNIFEDIVVFTKSYDSEGQHPLRSYSKQVLEYIGHSLNDINKDLGHRGAEHFFYVESSQFELCTKKTYTELMEEYSIDAMDGFKDYDTIEAIDREYKQQHQPVFNLPEGEKTKPNVFEYSKPHEGKHPTQKPVSLLADLIKTFSNPGDLVVDLTAGSGSTCVAADRTDRRFIGIEKDETYAEIARTRIGEQPKNPQLLRDHANQSGLESFGKDHIPQRTP